MSAVIYRLYWDFCSYLRPMLKRVLKFSKMLAGNYSKSSMFQSVTAIFMFGSILCFIVVMGSSYFYMFPSSETVVDTGRSRDGNNISKECNVFDGKWVVDDSYPLYNASDCPFVEHGFDCVGNGRKDRDYLKWRWKPRNCEIPRFDVGAALKYLRGKRVVFVGDSLSRTQWESMVCMLMSGVEDKRFVYEANGNEITKQIRHLSVRFETFSLTVEFYRSVFLVQPGAAPKHSPKRVKAVLKLDQMDDISSEWIDSDILIFNSGHWWTRTKLFELGWYFQNGGRTKFGMPISNGFKIALATWKSWVEKVVNPNKTRVFFRTFESSHWSSGSRQNCKVTRLPTFKAKGKQRSSVSDAIIKTMNNVSVPVKLLHVTQMGASRSDAHVGSWSDNPSVPDCSHWCLPGLPDVWNELLFSFLLSK
ncbi:protein trichome berefringence-like 7 [Salvia hispanica]|uniref:protein trichome berefringence-like 7 n=1 Tax=Salvia hispanica TaxID=49212 RepID=UPI0020093712|nr:protein trichome berefringence-like 7 [Salvia hispanica]XP_047983714.1 protein trichome berefringence-like 7 [Salvia hispanica]